MSPETMEDPPLKQILDKFVRLLAEEDGVSADAIQRIEEMIEHGKLKDHNVILETLSSLGENEE